MAEVGTVNPAYHSRIILQRPIGTKVQLVCMRGIKEREAPVSRYTPRIFDLLQIYKKTSFVVASAGTTVRFGLRKRLRGTVGPFWKSLRTAKITNLVKYSTDISPPSSHSFKPQRPSYRRSFLAIHKVFFGTN